MIFFKTNFPSLAKQHISPELVILKLYNTDSCLMYVQYKKFVKIPDSEKVLEVN